MAKIKQDSTSCFNCVGQENICTYCQKGVNVRYGYTKGGNQRLRCTSCGKTRVKKYRYTAYGISDQQIVTLTIEGLGIRSTARVLCISVTTLLKRLLKIAANIPFPTLSKKKIYEVDELCCFVKNKNNKIWVVYALERVTHKIVSFCVGKRTNKTLNVVIKTLLNAQARYVYTDSLKQYKSLLPESIHRVVRYGTNHIERSNLSVRTCLKRFSRRSLCFSKSIKMLKAILKIYFWNTIPYHFTHKI
ncbi:MAG: IS1 family transposase [Capnocytophaga sp.]|nr:IS1 family transposase [Capnocytophaga sp.]